MALLTFRKGAGRVTHQSTACGHSYNERRGQTSTPWERLSRSRTPYRFPRLYGLLSDGRSLYHHRIRPRWTQGQLEPDRLEIVQSSLSLLSQVGKGSIDVPLSRGISNPDPDPEIIARIDGGPLLAQSVGWGWLRGRRSLLHNALNGQKEERRRKRPDGKEHWRGEMPRLTAWVWGVSF